MTADQQEVVVAHPQTAKLAADTDDPQWPLAYASALVMIDCVAIYLALVAGYMVRFANTSGMHTQDGISYSWLIVVGGPLWLAALVTHRCYNPRLFGVGPAEFRRVVLASVRLFGVIAIVCYLAKFGLSRGFLAGVFAVGLALLSLGRHFARMWLRRKRRDGGWGHRVLIVGATEHVDDLARVLAREPNAGYHIVGACVPGGAGDERTPGGVPSYGALVDVLDAAKRSRCDTIAVTASPGISSATLRRLAWGIEGSGISLVVAPALTDVAGPRIAIQPVAGLPLLHVDEPELGLLHRSVKRVMDVAITSVGLVLLSPVFVVLAVLVRLSSPGPAIFRQWRIGRDGERFCAYKFRSMYVDAEQRLEELLAANEAEGAMFKIRDDPRITRVGRLLRRTSLDELPQLWNVLRGDMSLVGPRPPLPREVEMYGNDVRRRLLVKPGITGLWQVSGRSDLSWEDTVRLDLYYVENWSPLLDLVILLRTVTAVARGSGAY